MKKPCLKILKDPFRSVKPVEWLLMLVLLTGICAAFVPRGIWNRLIGALWCGRLLTGLLLLFALISVSLVWAGGQRIDAALFRLFNGSRARPRWLDALMLLLTQLGNGAVALILAPVLFIKADHMLAYQLLLGTLFLWMVVETVKTIATRSRPYSKIKSARVVGRREGGYSFPSGHTSQAFYTATLIGRYFGASPGVYALLYLAALLVGVTRMYVGVHYPRDVIAGACLGSAWGVIGTLMYAQLCA